MKSSTSRFLHSTLHLRLFAINLPSTELREITDALVILSISVLSYLATNWIIVDGVFGVPQLRPSIFVGIALATFCIRRMQDQRRERNQRLAAEQRAHTLLVRDPLTQLPNRRLFETEISISLKSGKRPIILLLGLDNFKQLDALYGRVGCDAALCQVGERIREAGTPDDLIARVADDEFALCFERTDLEILGRKAVGLVHSLRKPVQIGVGYHSIDVKVGIVQADRDATSVEELLRCAHVALSTARNKKVECCLFDPRMDEVAQERSVLEKDFRAALDANQIRSYYQPIVDVKSRRIVSFESLARWNHPVRGLICPNTFIPLAEELGLIDQLSGQLFADACRTAVTWPNDIALSFNFSPVQLGNRNLPAVIQRVLDDTGLPPYRLEVEVTESALVTDLGATRDVLQMLRNSGVRIVIDDFGTGYSSLYHLYELRFDKLKIDRHFIQELGVTEESDIFARAIMGLSNGLELCVTAEGVETDAQVAALAKLGTHQGQGFLFGKAMPASEVAQVLSVKPLQIAA
jgi:diguanylate cyclase (GGDEF)-like protein